MPTRLSKLVVTDITQVAVAVGFVHLPAIFDAWSAPLRATPRTDVDARFARAVLQAAIATRQPQASCTIRTGRGSQYDAVHCRAQLEG